MPLATGNQMWPVPLWTEPELDLSYIFSDMFGLAGLVSARAIVMKMTSPGNIGIALGYFTIVHSIMESLASEYYLLYTSTKKSYYSKFIYCFNAVTFLLVKSIQLSLSLPNLQKQIKLYRGECNDSSVLCINTSTKFPHGKKRSWEGKTHVKLLFQRCDSRARFDYINYSYFYVFTELRCLAKKIYKFFKVSRLNLQINMWFFEIHQLLMLPSTIGMSWLLW